MSELIGIAVTNMSEWHKILRDVKRAASVEEGVPQQIVKQEAMADIRRRFETQTSPTGVRWKPPKSGGRALMKTMRMMNSFYPIVTGPDVFITTMDERARIHNDGGMVQPKPGGSYIAVPATEEIARFKGRRSFRQAFPGAFVMKTTKGGRLKLGLYQRLGQTRRLERIASLLPFVRMPQREIVGMSREAWANVLQRIRVEAVKAWR